MCHKLKKKKKSQIFILFCIFFVLNVIDLVFSNSYIKPLGLLL